MWYNICMPNTSASRLLAIAGVLLLIAIAVFAYTKFRPAGPVISSFDECVAAGNAVMESYPRQCRTPDGVTFREDVGGELEKDDLIRVSNPRPNATVTSPLAIEGVARGNWFFETNFPIRLVDASEKELGRAVAQAEGEWMTTEFVPFKATLSFLVPTTQKGTLILEKDNPSGLPEHADELRIPVTFASPDGGAVAPPVAKACVASGCSGQICAEEEVMSTCEFRPEYACYRTARCERTPSGECGWTETPALRACLQNPPPLQ